MKKLLLFLTVIILCITTNVYAFTGWKTTKSKTYYYNNDVKYTGLKTIDGEKYYFNSLGVLQKNKLIIIKSNKYYVNSSGIVEYGWKTLDGKKYYFDLETGKALKGYQTIDEKSYYFNTDTCTLRIGWQTIGNDKFYSDSEGVVKTGWQEIDGKKYYFNTDSPYQAYRGYKTIDGNLYFFNDSNGNLRVGWEKYKNKRYYSDSNGIVQKGKITIDGVEHSLNENKPYEAISGVKEIDGKKYVFDEYGTLAKGKTIIFGNEYYSDDNGEFINIRYIPKYYKQKDSKWTNKKFGKYTFGSTGCSPTSMAMAFQSILEREVLPTEVGEYLYKNTNQYNRIYCGTSGKGIIYASKQYGVEVKPIKSKSKLKDYLDKGYIVYASMQNGKFATKYWNHAIIMYDLKDNTTYALDPLIKSNNGYVSIDLIWKEKNTDPDDLLGGSAIYALMPNKQI